MAFSGSAGATMRGSTAWTRLRTPSSITGMIPADERSLSDNGVGCVYQDRNGVLWVGTRGGLNRLDPASGTFVRYYPDGRDAGCHEQQ